MEKMFKPIGNKPRIEKILNILRLLNGMFDLLKKISWQFVSFFIVYLALVGYAALKNPLNLREMIRNPDFSENYFMSVVCLVFIAESVKIFATKLPMEYGVEIVCLSLTSMFSIMAGYSPENFVVIALIYLSAATLEWVSGKVFLFLYKRQGSKITEERTESIPPSGRAYAKRSKITEERTEIRHVRKKGSDKRNYL